jgi:RecB family endonuclease NucS
LPLDKEGKVYLEDILRAWLIANIDNPNRKDLRDIFGPTEDIEWFANNVPYHVTRKNIDILCYHKNIKYTGFPLRYKFSVVELKRDIAVDKDVFQLIEYSKWVAGRLAGSEIETIQPVLIAFDFNDRAKLKAQNSDFSERRVSFFRYEVKNGDIKFEKVDY